MNKYRIGTDVPFQLSVDDGVEYLDLSNCTILNVAMYCDAQEAFAGSCTWELNAEDHTRIDCVYPGNRQAYTGIMRAVVVMVGADGGKKAYDLADIFEIVAATESANATEDTVTNATLSAWQLPMSTLATIVEAAINATEAATDSAIAEISYTASTEDDGINILHIEQEDGTGHDFNIKNGSRGPQGPQGETGPQGPQGNTGSSVEYPFEIVNNLSEGGVDKALSAEQGKVLNQKLYYVKEGQTTTDNITPTSYVSSGSVEDTRQVIPVGAKLTSITLFSTGAAAVGKSKLTVYDATRTVVKEVELSTIGTADTTTDLSGENIIMQEGYHLGVYRYGYKYDTTAAPSGRFLNAVTGDNWSGGAWGGWFFGYIAYHEGIPTLEGRATALEAEVDDLNAAIDKPQRELDFVGAGQVLQQQNFTTKPGHRYLVELSNNGYDITGVTSGYKFVIGQVVTPGTTRSLTRIGRSDVLNKSYEFFATGTDYYIQMRAAVGVPLTVYITDLTESSMPLHEYSGERVELGWRYTMNRAFGSYTFGSLAMGLAGQGMDTYEDTYLFLGSGGSNVAANLLIVNLNTLSVVGQIAHAESTHHMGQLNCGAKYSEDDTFPLIYLSSGALDDHSLCVLRINNAADAYTQVQRIVYTGTAHFSDYPSVNWCVDLENGCIYAVGSPASPGDVLEIVKFPLPPVSTASVSYGDADVLDSFTLPLHQVYQSIRAVHGKLLVPLGYGTATYPARLWVIDPVRKAKVTDILLADNMEWEAIAPYRDGALMETGSTVPIFTFIKFL